MAFKTVGGARQYYKYSECNEGDMLINNGKYLGSEQGKFGVQHLFEVEGVTHVLNSAGQLNYLVEKHLSPNQRCNVTYKGTITLEKGPMAGKDSHQFEMQVDDGFEAAAAAAPSVNAVTKPVSTPQVDMKPVGKAKAAKKAAPAAYVPVGDDIEL